LKKVLLANWNTSSEFTGGQESFFLILDKYLNARQISFTSASKVLNDKPKLNGFAAVFRGRIIDYYLREYEKWFPLDVIVKNSGIGGYLELKTPVVTIFQDPYDTISRVLYFYGYFLPHMEHYNACIDLQRRTGKQSVYNIAVSDFMQEYCKKIGVKCHKVINEGVDMQYFKPLDKKQALRKKWGVPLDKKVGLSVIKFHPAKGWHILVELIKAFPEIFWVICFTEPPDDRIGTAATNVPFIVKTRRKNVKAFQMLPREKMVELYNLADFFVLPSCSESFGLSSLEAAACNIPIIMQKTGWVWNFWNKKLGFRVDKWEIGHYVEAVENVLSQSQIAPREVVVGRFPVEKCGEAWKRLIDSIN